MLTIDADHIYRWWTPVEGIPAKHGEIVPGVNEILGDMGVIQGQQFMTDESAYKGRRRHKALELYNEGKLDWATVEEEDYFYLMAWQEFSEDVGLVVSATELMVYNEDQHYAGTLDVTATMCKDDLMADWILDVKTGSSQPYHQLQLSLYADALAPKGRCKIGCVYLRPGKKKNYNFKEYEYSTDAICIVHAWQWANKKREWIKERE